MNAERSGPRSFSRPLPLAVASGSDATYGTAQGQHTRRVTEAEVLRRIFDAYNDDDVDGVVAGATDDVTYVFGPRGIRMTGRDGWRQVVAGIAAAVPGRRLEIVRLAAADGAGVVEWVIRGVSSGAVDGYPAAGEPVILEGCTVVGFRDERVCYVRDYMG